MNLPVSLIQIQIVPSLTLRFIQEDSEFYKFAIIPNLGIQKFIETENWAGSCERGEKVIGPFYTKCKSRIVIYLDTYCPQIVNWQKFESNPKLVIQNSSLIIKDLT